MVLCSVGGQKKPGHMKVAASRYPYLSRGSKYLYGSSACGLFPVLGRLLMRETAPREGMANGRVRQASETRAEPMIMSNCWAGLRP